MVFNDSGSGVGWDTRIEMGRTNDFSIGTGFPLYQPAGGYGVMFQANSDGVFYGMEEYSSGHYRPVINWGDDVGDTPFRISFNNATVASFTSTGSLEVEDTVIAKAGTGNHFVGYNGATSVIHLGYNVPYGGRMHLASGGTGLQFYTFSSSKWIGPCDNGGNNVDNAIDLGTSSVRFDDVYATNGTIQTSDRNEKQDIQALTDAEQRVATACKGLIRRYRWISSVEEKGDDARYHFGAIAQDVEAAFIAEGLDAGDYALFIKTTWWEYEGVSYDTQESAPEGAVENTRLGLRYNQLFAFIISAI